MAEEFDEKMNHSIAKMIYRASLNTDGTFSFPSERGASRNMPCPNYSGNFASGSELDEFMQSSPTIDKEFRERFERLVQTEMASLKTTRNKLSPSKICKLALIAISSETL